MKQFEYDGVLFKIGDRVRIDRAIESFAPNGMGEGKRWEAMWNDSMHARVGSTGVIRSFNVNHEGQAISVRVGHENATSFFGRSAWNYPAAVLTNLTSNPQPKYDLKPFMRAVTRNGWQFIVASHEACRESSSPYAPLFLVQRGGMECPIMWPGEQKALEGALEIVEVYAPGEYINEILREDKRGELLWTETMDVEKAAKAQTIARLQQQRDELDSRIQELGAE